MSGITAGNMRVLDGLKLLPYSFLLVWWSYDPFLAILLYCQNDAPSIFSTFYSCSPKLTYLNIFTILKWHTFIKFKHCN